MNTEVWKDIPGYEGRYQASSLGRVKSLKRVFQRLDRRTGKLTDVLVSERILKPGKFNLAGHLSVFLRDKEHPNGIGKPVHQLIAKTFFGEPPRGMEVLHINGVPTDNRIENLRYGTHSENGVDRYRHAGRGLKLTSCDVNEIRKLLATGVQQRQIAQRFGVSDTSIYHIKKGRRFQWLP
jgi:hypothetical protein